MIRFSKLTLPRTIQHQFVPVLGLLLLLSGCQQSMSLKVSSDVPTPLVSQIPLSMGVFYDAPLRDYVYEEDSRERPGWRISSGDAHIALFEQILAPMFNEVKEVPSLATDGSVDGVLSPKIEDMQFALPEETKTDLYEAWIKYVIELHDQNGDQIAAWAVTGYGRSSTEFMKSRDSGVNAAINQALRDAGAKFAIGFPEVVGVNAWLAEKMEHCEQYATAC